MPTLRSSLIRLAHMNESLRPHLLPLLKESATEHEARGTAWRTQDAMEAYLKKHPGAKRENHRVEDDSDKHKRERTNLHRRIKRDEDAVPEEEWKDEGPWRPGKSEFDAQKEREKQQGITHRMRVNGRAHRVDGVRGHVLMLAAITAKIPPIGGQENVDDPIVWVKYFSPYGNGAATWLVTEFDGSDEMFGWADLGMGGGELGSMSLSELEGLERRGLPLVERDTSWRPMPLSKAKRD